MRSLHSVFPVRAGLAVLFASLLATAAGAADIALLNVSYDPTRELYVDVNKAFAESWSKKNPADSLAIRQSHGGSGKQARGVIEGVDADVVTLALAYDIDAIADKGLINKDWQKRLPDNASPYTSTIVFLVRKGNPKGIKDWNDLVKPGVGIVTPDPATSGGARWNYLAAWGYALKQNGGDEAKARDFVKTLFRNVVVQDAGARGATLSFVEKGIGDVLLAWENEAYRAVNALGPDRFEIVTPSVSILAEPPVAVVDKVVDKRGTRAVSEAYLKFLYTPAGQEIAARHFYRPRDSSVLEKAKVSFGPVNLITIDQFGGWRKAQQEHFGKDGIFYKITAP